MSKTTTLFFVVIYTFILSSWRSTSGQVTTFVQRHLCVENGQLCAHSLLDTGLRMSELDCARECTADDQCLGLSLAKSRDLAHLPSSPNGHRYHPNEMRISTHGYETCVLHTECLTLITTGNCLQVDSSRVYKEKDGRDCQHGGVWMEELQRCDCSRSGGWVGKLCASAPRCCQDLATWGYRGAFYISQFAIPSLPPVVLLCSVISQSQYVSYVYYLSGDRKLNDFNKTWSEFENGFRLGQGNFGFWIGLKQMKHVLDLATGPDTTVGVSLSINRLENGTWRFVRIRFTYKDFRLSDASDGYRITFADVEERSFGLTDEQRARLPVCLKDLNGSRFSTFNRDLDRVQEENCAVAMETGFWYGDSCRPRCNLFGVFNDSNSPQNFRLDPWQNQTYLWAEMFSTITIDITVV